MDGLRLANADATDDVLGMLREQAELYGRLEAYSRRQRRLVGNDDVGPLLALLSERQRLSQELTSLAARLAPIRDQWSAFRLRLTSGERAEAEALIDEAGRRLRQVIEEDEQDARVLAGRRQLVAGALRTAQAGGAAMAAYRTPVPRAPRLNCVDGD